MKNKEDQNIEWKRKWDDSFLKQICSFANTEGGSVFIGIDDNGNVYNLGNIEQLLEKIPNKVITLLGISPEVNLCKTTQGEYIEIKIKPSSSAVAYKDIYYKRVGSTTRKITGNDLMNFLNEKAQKSWDSITIPNIKVKDLDSGAFELFKKEALKNNKISESILNDNNNNIIKNLDLIKNGDLTRAAILLFHKNPEKTIHGAYIRIAYFKSDTNVIFDDEIYGNLFYQFNKTIDLLETKYIKALISYEKQRKETYEYPYKALREAVLNAITHKDYSNGNPIEIKVYDDKIIIRNETKLPENWTVENVIKEHVSKPYNPNIAHVFSRAGFIERWGRGILLIIEKCKENNLPEPLFVYENPDFKLTIRKDYSNDYLEKLGLNERQVKAIMYIREYHKISNAKYRELCNTSKGTATRDLKELTEQFKIFIKKGKGAGIFYELI